MILPIRTNSSRIIEVDQRNNLKNDTIELLKCLKSWFRQGIFTEEYLYTIVDTLNEDKALEAAKTIKKDLKTVKNVD